MSDNLQIQYLPIDHIIPYPGNPRINEDAAKAVAMSIKEFGFKNPVLLDEHSVIIAGHTRLKAAKLLGITEIPVVYCSNLSPEQVKAFRIADNKVSEYSEWDEGLLLQEFDELKELGYDLSLTGFDDIEIDKLLTGEEEFSDLSALYTPDDNPFTSVKMVVTIEEKGIYDSYISMIKKKGDRPEEKIMQLIKEEIEFAKNIS